MAKTHQQLARKLFFRCSLIEDGPEPPRKGRQVLAKRTDLMDNNTAASPPSHALVNKKCKARSKKKRPPRTSSQTHARRSVALPSAVCTDPQKKTRGAQTPEPSLKGSRRLAPKARPCCRPHGFNSRTGVHHARTLLRSIFRFPEPYGRICPRNTHGGTWQCSTRADPPGKYQPTNLTEGRRPKSRRNYRRS